MYGTLLLAIFQTCIWCKNVLQFVKEETMCNVLGCYSSVAKDSSLLSHCVSDYCCFEGQLCLLKILKNQVTAILQNTESHLPSDSAFQPRGL